MIKVSNIVLSICTAFWLLGFMVFGLDTLSFKSAIAQTNARSGTVSCLQKASRFPLHDAARQNDIKWLKCLVSDGVDIDALDQSGNSALVYAVQASSIELVKFLIEAGADVNSEQGRPTHASVSQIFDRYQRYDFDARRSDSERLSGFSERFLFLALLLEKGARLDFKAGRLGFNILTSFIVRICDDPFYKLDHKKWIPLVVNLSTHKVNLLDDDLHAIKMMKQVSKLVSNELQSECWATAENILIER